MHLCLWLFSENMWKSESQRVIAAKGAAQNHRKVSILDV